MKCAAVAAWSAVLLVGVATAAYAAAQGDPSPPKRDEAKAAKSLEATFGKTLIAIDGSTIEIIASEGRISREIVTPNGAVQRSNFVFINARLGTVADAREASRVLGVFRASDSEMLIQYGDGSSETVVPNSDGGITIEMSSPKNPTYCTAWYPEGHVFSLEDRKAALLQYANRLGLGVSTEKAAGPPATSGCESVAPAATAASSTTSAPAASPVPAAAPAPAALAPPAAAPAMEKPDAPQKAASLVAPKPGAGTPQSGGGNFVVDVGPLDPGVPLGDLLPPHSALDGEIVKFYVDGRLDSQAALVNGIRPSTAPLVMGNVLDVRRLGRGKEVSQVLPPLLFRPRLIGNPPIGRRVHDDFGSLS